MSQDQQPLFASLPALLEQLAVPGEILLAATHFEDSYFARFNQAALRQSGRIEQKDLELSLICDGRECSKSMRIGAASDLPEQLRAAVDELRDVIKLIPADPFLADIGPVQQNWQFGEGNEVDGELIAKALLDSSAGLDFVGILAAGSLVSGFASSQGHSLLRRSAGFNLDYSLHAGGDKAVKASLAGTEFQPEELHQSLLRSAAELEVMKRPAISIPPGDYDAYIAPAALQEFMDMLNWGGFSADARKSGRSGLLRLVEGQVQMSEMLNLTENSAAGFGPHFQDRGFLRLPQVPLIRAGRDAGALVSPRSAKEYGLVANGADSDERTFSLQMDAGELPMAEAATRLGRGLYINNLWYLNYSERNACRITGMTRFACFWVDEGRIVAPLNVMRFDDSLFDLLGGKLEALTSERQLLIDPGTYFRRSTSSMLLPGALVRGMKFTL